MCNDPVFDAGLDYCEVCGYDADCPVCIGEFDCVEDFDDAVANGYDGSCDCGSPACDDCYPE